MRANPLVCVEADEVVSAEQWVSVIVFGRYEELLDTPEYQGTRALAHALLKRHSVWWEPAYAKTILRGAQRSLEPVFYRIQGRQITGHRAVPDQPVTAPDARLSVTDSGKHRWLHSLLRRVQGQRQESRPKRRER
jgi:nitroimidazol reductase NimA-like FMN-containing flavoprotein (pyridoxamine 5'-phosphate oxidase superfamily)